MDLGGPERKRNPPRLGRGVFYPVADSDQSGMLSLPELLRVNELYTTRADSTRTGKYALNADSADGFASGE